MFIYAVSGMLLCMQIFPVISGGPPAPEPSSLIGDQIVLSDSAISEAQDLVLEWYMERGYLFASVGCYLSDPDTLVLNVVPGRHCNLEDVRFEGLENTRPSTLLRYLRLRKGEPFDHEVISEWLERIARLPFISSIGASKLCLGIGGDLILIQEVFDGPSGYFSASFGGASGGAASGSSWDGGGQLEITNLLGTGRELELEVQRVDWGGVDASGRYREPWIGSIPVSAEIRLSQEVPDSARVNREAELVGIWSEPVFEVWSGAGIWRGYPPEGADESWDYGIFGMLYDSRKKVVQGFSGLQGNMEARIGSRSGVGDSSGIFAEAALECRYDSYSGLFGLGSGLSAGGVVEGEWLIGRLKRLGGQETLRGYGEGAFRGGRYVIVQPEISLGETATRIYLFADFGWIDTVEGDRYPFGSGLGIRSSEGVFFIDAALGVPVREGFSLSRIYVTVRAVIL